QCVLIRTLSGASGAASLSGLPLIWSTALRISLLRDGTPQSMRSVPSLPCSTAMLPPGPVSSSSPAARLITSILSVSNGIGGGGACVVAGALAVAESPRVVRERIAGKTIAAPAAPRTDLIIIRRSIDFAFFILFPQQEMSAAIISLTGARDD